MALFFTDSIVLVCTNVEAAKRWWIEVFEAQSMKPPSDWDSSLPSDVAIKLPGHDQPTVLLTSKSELKQAHMDSSETYPVLFTGKLKKAHELLVLRASQPDRCKTVATCFFEITDPEGHTIQVAKNADADFVHTLSGADTPVGPAAERRLAIARGFSPGYPSTSTYRAPNGEITLRRVSKRL